MPVYGTGKPGRYVTSINRLYLIVKGVEPLGGS